MMSPEHLYLMLSSSAIFDSRSLCKFYSSVPAFQLGRLDQMDLAGTAALSHTDQALGWRWLRGGIDSAHDPVRKAGGRPILAGVM